MKRFSLQLTLISVQITSQFLDRLLGKMQDLNCLFKVAMAITIQLTQAMVNHEVSLLFINNRNRI